MNKTSKPVGRPPFRIDGDRLRDLRKEAGLTQLALAQRVYNRAGKGAASPEVLKNTAQRWESTGAVPQQMALHLAGELGTTLAVLQGALPAPAPSMTEELEGRLKRLITNGPPALLAEALEYCKESDNPIREVAAALASRLEFAQLSQAQSEFAELASITGYSIKELRQPASFEGFWMLLRAGPVGPTRSEIVTGVRDILDAVRAEMQASLNNWQGSDSNVSFTEEKHWFQVIIHHPIHAQLTRVLRFVRCQPKESGLQWSSPTSTDRYWLKELSKEAYGHANFVTGFDSVRVPADCSNLRIAITKVPDAPENFDDWRPDVEAEVIAMTTGGISDQAPLRLESFKKEGNFHDLVIRRLTTDLWEKLLPLMSDWPLECWSFRRAQSRIDVLLNVPYRIYATSNAPLRFGHRFSVKLVEAFPDGQQQTAPWAEKSVAFVHAKLTQSLLDAREKTVSTPNQTSTE